MIETPFFWGGGGAGGRGEVGGSGEDEKQSNVSAVGDGCCHLGREGGQTCSDDAFTVLVGGGTVDYGFIV